MKTPEYATAGAGGPTTGSLVNLRLILNILYSLIAVESAKVYCSGYLESFSVSRRWCNIAPCHT